MAHQNPKLFFDPHITYPALSAHLSFDDYIAECTQIIADTRLGPPETREKAIQANAPFEYRPTGSQSPYPYGALLVHGLIASPFQMRDIGEYLQSKGFLVRAVLLPGHGTVPGALLNTHHSEWLETIRYGVASLAQEVKNIFLVGQSTGAALNTYYTLQNPSEIAGLINFAPAFKINSAFDFLTSVPPKLSYISSRLNWFDFSPDEFLEYTRYHSMTYNAIQQVYQLGRKIKWLSSSQPLTCPLFIAISENDNVVSPRAARQYFASQGHPKSRFIFYTTRPSLQSVEDPRVVLRSSVYPDWHIRHFSHICLATAPDNPFYGKNGEFPYASHVETEKNTCFGEYSSSQLFLNSILFRYKLAPLRYQRLTFNPDFNYVLQAIDQFLAI